MKQAESFIERYYMELSKYGSSNNAVLMKENDRQEIFKRSYKGDASDRQYVKTHIKKVMTDMKFREVLINETYLVTPENIDEQLNLKNISEDQYRVLIHLYGKEYGEDAFYKLLERYDHCKDSVITHEMLHRIYESENYNLTYEDKLEILVQKVYENFRGIPVVDTLLYQNLEDVQVGVSGKVDEAYKSIWVILSGQLMRLEFLQLKDNNQLEDVCKKIAGDEKIDTVSAYAFGYGLDGSRRVAFKQGFSEVWCAIVRKFNTVSNLYNKDLLELSGVRDIEKLILIEKLLMKGCVSTVLIGDQGSGKTVKTVRLVEYIDDEYSIRTINNNFEGFIRNLYPWKNIIEYRETEEIDEEEAYEVSLKSSGKVTIFTEVRKNKMIEQFLNSGRRGSKMAMTSMHHTDPEKVPYELGKGLMKEGLHKNISDAIDDVLEVLKAVIHVRITEDKRRVYDVYELVNCSPNFSTDIYSDIDTMDGEAVMKTIAKSLVRIAQPTNFMAMPIIIYDENQNAYVTQNEFTERLKTHIKKNLKQSDYHLLDDAWRNL